MGVGMGVGMRGDDSSGRRIRTEQGSARRPCCATTGGLSRTALATGPTSLLMLVAGTYGQHTALLAWGVVVAAVAVGTGCVAVVLSHLQAHTEALVDRCVTRTAVTVGETVATALREQEDGASGCPPGRTTDDPPGGFNNVVTLYS